MMALWRLCVALRDDVDCFRSVAGPVFLPLTTKSVVIGYSCERKSVRAPFFCAAVMVGFQTRKGLAERLGYELRKFNYVVYGIPQADRYTPKALPKADGTQRLILVPHPALKTLQRRLAKLLEDDLAAMLRASTTRVQRRAACSYRPGKSIVDNANVHVGMSTVLRVDLKDYFPSINFGRVRGLFLKHTDWGFSAEVATTIAKIGCHDEHGLPQGSPLSPILSELVASAMDRYMCELARRYRLRYSRYADDLTFSTKLETFPNGIVRRCDEGPEAWRVGEVLRRVVRRSGFTINEAKTRVMPRTRRQIVTGLVVNAKPSVPKEYRRHTRAMLHSFVTRGSFHMPGCSRAVTARNGDAGASFDPRTLLGRLEFQAQVQRATASRQPPVKSVYTSKFPSQPEAQIDLFWRYVCLQADVAPLVVCEGKTDVIYLKQALRHYAKQYPRLAKPNGEPRLTFLNRTDNRSTRSVATRLGLNATGAGAFKNFLADCLRMRHALKTLAGHDPHHPCILVVDNDDAGEVVLKQFEGKLGGVCDEADGFWKGTKDGSFYLVQTPVSGADIEALFPESVLSRKLSDLNFESLFVTYQGHEAKSIRNPDGFDKWRFATKVVPTLGPDDFGGFKPLLMRLDAVIADHRKTKSTGDSNS